MLPLLHSQTVDLLYPQMPLFNHNKRDDVQWYQ